MANLKINWINNKLSLKYHNETIIIQLIKITAEQTILTIKNKELNGNDLDFILITMWQAKKLAKQKDIEFFLLFTHELIDCRDSVNPYITQLIDCFCNVVHIDMPPRLPPSQNLDHEIWLFYGTKPPSRLIYQLSHMELAELKRQLKDLFT